MNDHKLFLLILFAISFICLAPNTSEAQMPQLNQKYQRLERQAPVQLQNKITDLRTLGKQQKWTFQVGNTSVAKFIDKNIKAITGASLPTPSAGTSNRQFNSNKSTINSGPHVASSGNNLNTGINSNASRFDLRSKGWVSPVRDQGGCGSCWAFCSVACIETAQIAQNGGNANNINLSEQYALSCSGAGSCGGGQPHRVFDHFKNNNKGCPQESSFNYTASNASCPSSPAFTNNKVETWGWVGNNRSHANVQEVKNAIAKYGAVETYIWVNSAFAAYTNGVINNNSRTGWGGWHCVQIVGWDNAKSAYLIKNSWGTGWGMSGFGWVRYNVLSVGDWSAYVVAKKQQTINMNGYFSCNDGGHYYVRQIGNKVFWFGEKPNGSWANVFKGTLSGSSLTGYFYDVPKGAANGRGELRLSVSNGGKNISKISGPFGGTRWTKRNLPSTLPGVRPAGFSQVGNINDMDGAWTCNDGGIYYIREIGGKIAWFGEGNLNSSGKPGFANVAIGTRSGNTITVEWADVPKCGMKGKGKLRLRVNSANEIVKTAGGGFGGSKWTRKPNLDGTWRNKDANTRGVTKIVLSNKATKIHTFGACSPSDCDWGTATLRPSGSAYKATYNQGFAKKYLTLYCLSNGDLKLVVFADYNDSRPDRTSTYYFKK